jgi:hypothetical protein
LKNIEKMTTEDVIFALVSKVPYAALVEDEKTLFYLLRAYPKRMVELFGDHDLTQDVIDKAVFDSKMISLIDYLPERLTTQQIFEHYLKKVVPQFGVDLKLLQKFESFLTQDLVDKLVAEKSVPAEYFPPAFLTREMLLPEIKRLMFPAFDADDDTVYAGLTVAHLKVVLLLYKRGCCNTNALYQTRESLVFLCNVVKMLN